MLNDIFHKLFRHKKASKDTAKKRLKFTLVYDKLEVSDDILTELQNDIVNVISRYFEIDTSSLKLNIKKSDDTSALVLNTPILSARRRVPSS
ncbi:MAG: cell division topological specificity factor MinE [Proteobacteria bacterium]|nr:cell division topological specificity factor MinE [Pseudomonadota bacterium]